MMRVNRYRWDFEDMRLKALREQRRKYVEALNLDENRFIESDLSIGELLEQMKDYKAPNQRRWIRINSKNFKNAIDILAKQINYHKEHRHQAVNFMRCCLLYWFGVVPKALAHVVDSSFKCRIDARTVMCQARSMHQEELYGVELNEPERIKKQLEEDYMRSQFDPTFVFNPDLGDISKAYTPYLE